MSNLSDKEIDRLSREAADFYEPDDSSLSWSRLEQKLTEQMPERPPDGFRFGRISPYVWGAAIVMLAGISFFVLQNINYSKHSTLKDQPVTQSAPDASGTVKETGENAIRVDSISSAENLNTNESKNAASEKQSSLSDGSSTNKKVSSPGEPESNPRNTGSSSTASNELTRPAVKNLSGGTKKIPANRNSASKGLASTSVVPASIVAAESPAAGGSDKLSSQNKANDINSSNSSIGTNDISGTNRNKNQLSLPALIIAGTGPGNVKGNDALLNQLAAKTVKIPNKSLRINRSLNFGLTFGPDYTDAGGIENNQIGNNIGLTIGYYLTNKLSVNTGMIYSNRFYWSPGHEATPQQYRSGPSQYATAGTFAAPPPVEYVNGSSNMWELPLTLRYDFAKNQKTKFFANAGLSSYFIMKQTNIYFFHNGQRAAAWKSTDNEQINYWFGVADISFGLETSIGKGFSFQMEPYFKIPLRSMGVENLKLNSYGFLISFRYSPVLSRTKN
jgi:cytoskeletal protein RodZ